MHLPNPEKPIKPEDVDAFTIPNLSVLTNLFRHLKFTMSGFLSKSPFGTKNR